MLSHQPKITVVGAGRMGQGIAVVFLRAGFDVAVYDVQDRLETSLLEIQQRLENANRIDPSSHPVGVIRPYGDLKTAVSTPTLVFEAVPEQYELKRDVLREIDCLAPSSTIFATNTSSLALGSLSSELATSRTLIAVHFFNPAEIVPGVEIAGEDEEVIQQVVTLLRSVGKRPVRVAPAPGFVANRLQLALFREAVLCVEEGLASPEDIDEIVRSTFGLRLASYGPLQIADMAGLEVFAAILETLSSVYGDRFAQPQLLKELVSQGNLGAATGSGFYDYLGINMERFLDQRDVKFRAVVSATNLTPASGAEAS